MGRSAKKRHREDAAADIEPRAKKSKVERPHGSDKSRAVEEVGDERSDHDTMLNTEECLNRREEGHASAQRQPNQIENQNESMKKKKKKRGKHIDRDQETLAPAARDDEISRRAGKDASPDGMNSDDHLEPRKHKKDKKHKIQYRLRDEGWTVSEPVGGLMANIDPVFSQDERYFMIAYATCMRVYAVSTSLLLRTLNGHEGSTIVGICIVPHSNDHVYVAYKDGNIEEYDFTDGQQKGRWRPCRRLSHFAFPRCFSDDNHKSVFFTTTSQGGWSICAAKLGAVDRIEPVELFSKRNFSHLGTDTFQQFKVLHDSGAVIASSRSHLIIGLPQKLPPDAVDLDTLNYVWRTFECTQWITSLDVKEKPFPEKASKYPPIDVVAGGHLGALFLFYNVIKEFSQFEFGSSKSPPNPKVVHWHRSPVASVKWSLDGNYTISGAEETVILVQQLDTGKRQFLPHLSAPIESIVVSPSGTLYGIRIASNAAMVLSTKDLAPTLSVADVQLAGIHVDRPNVPLGDASANDAYIPTVLRRPTVTHFPAGSLQIQLAAPGRVGSRLGRKIDSNPVYLQRYDAKSGTQVARQALTRTNITDRYTGPEHNVIEDPSIVLMQISSDGKWMATVDEWSPPRQDIEPSGIEEDLASASSLSRMEIHLKFWSLGAGRQWELVTRIDDPHLPSGESATGARILDITADTSKLGFVTAGDDACVKIWRPKKRVRGGQVVKDRSGEAAVNWVCHRTISLPGFASTALSQQQFQPIARTAVSEDGSILAVGFQTDELTTIFLIDPYDGSIRACYNDIVSGLLISLAIIDRYLVVLSGALLVWDLVDDDLHYGFFLESSDFSLETQHAAVHLAINHKKRTFAISIPSSDNISRIRQSIFAVCSVDGAEPLFATKLPNALKAVVSDPTRDAFVTIDHTARVRIVTPQAQLSKDETATTENERAENGGLMGFDRVYGKSLRKLAERPAENRLKLLNDAADEEQARVGEAEGEDRVVGAAQLSELFASTQSFALPPVSTLFEKVASLFAGRSEAATK